MYVNGAKKDAKKSATAREMMNISPLFFVFFCPAKESEEM